MKGLLSAFLAFWKSLFQGKKVNEKPKQSSVANVDDVARKFYDDLLDADMKRKK